MSLEKRNKDPKLSLKWKLADFVLRTFFHTSASEVQFVIYHPLFDKEYYRNQYKGWFAHRYPGLHYCLIGFKKHYSPSLYFNTAYYFLKNRDVKSAGVNPFLHYLIFGFKERRNPNPFFDSEYYGVQYLEKQHKVINPLSHYLSEGWKKSFNPSPFFEASFYKSSYGLNSNEEPLKHFLMAGHLNGNIPYPTEGQYHLIGASKDRLMNMMRLRRFDTFIKKMTIFVIKTNPHLNAIPLKMRAVSTRQYAQEKGEVIQSWAGENVEIKAPKILSKTPAHWPGGAVDLPARYMYSFKQVYQVGASRGLLSFGLQHLIHPEIDMLGNKYEYKLREIIWRKRTLIEMRVRVKQDQVFNRGLVLSCDHTNNYFHFVAECLTRFVMVRDLPEVQGLPILVDSKLHPNLREALNIVNKNKNPIVDIDSSFLYLFEKILTFPEPSILLDKYTGEIELQDLVLSVDKTREMVKAMKDQFTAIYSKPPNRRVYLARKPVTYRNLVNQDKIIACLQEFNFEIIYPEAMTFTEQVELMAQCSHVVAPSGASCTNIFFCHPKTQFAIFNFNHPNANLYLYNQVATIADINLTFILGERIGKINGKYEIHDDYKVNIDLIKTYLKGSLSEKDNQPNPGGY